MGKLILAADLFCGAGGTSTGLSMAANSFGKNLQLIAVNHWDRAIETHLAVDAIEQAGRKAIKMFDRITGNDLPDSEETAEVQEPCLQTVLENTPDQIRKKIDTIMGTLNDIETVLF